MRILSPEQYQWISSRYPITRYQALCGDAGFRRYFRLYTDKHSYIFMDASEEPTTYHAFIQQTNHLSQYAFPVPKLLAQDDRQFCAIMEDFGDDLLFEVFQAVDNPLPLADRFYRQAIDHLIRLNQMPVKAFGRLSVLDAKVMLDDFLGWQEWCLEKLFKQHASSALISCYQRIIDVVLQQPYIFMHRDFHCKNLLKKPNGDLGIIDYQDAMSGPMTYDLASLLRDCYIDWPEEQIKQWVLYYKRQAQQVGLLNHDVSDELFLTWFDWTSIQRHLKALFTFARKSLRDHNDHYLQFVPRTLHYLEKISARYSELSALTQTIKILREKS